MRALRLHPLASPRETSTERNGFRWRPGGRLIGGLGAAPCVAATCFFFPASVRAEPGGAQPPAPLAPSTEPGAESSASTADSPPPVLDEVVVEAPLVETDDPTATKTELTEAELEQFEEDDVQKVLLRVPGVQVRGEDGLGLRPNIGLRGTSPERSKKVALMEDGILLGPAPYSAPAAYYFPLITRMTAVDVHKGGAQIRFGPNAIGGAIDLHTAPIPDGGAGMVDAALGQYGYQKLHLRYGYGTDRTGFVLEGVHLGATGFKELDGGGDTGFDKNELMAKWRVNSAPEADVYHQLDVKLGFATELSNETYVGLTDEDLRDNPRRRYVSTALDQMRWHRGQTQATYTVIPSDGFEVSITGYRNVFTRNWFKLNGFEGASITEVLADPDSARNRVFYEVLTGEVDSASSAETLLHGENHRHYVSQGIQAKARAEGDLGGFSHEVEVGLRFHHDEVERVHTEHSFTMTSGNLAATGQPNRITTQNHGEARALSIHVVDEIQIQRLRLSPGARVEVVSTSYEDALEPSFDNESSQTAFLPGAGAHYALTDELGLLAGIYTGFSPAAPQRRSQSTDANPERSITYELGARGSTDRAFAEVVGFLNDYSNLTSTCNEAASCSDDQVGEQFNGGEVHVYGLEVAAAYEHDAGPLLLPLRTTYTLIQSEFLNDFDSSNPEWGQIEAGFELPYVPTHQLSVVVGARQEEKWSVDLSAVYASAAREVAGTGTPRPEDRTDSYLVFSVSGRVRVTAGGWLYAKLDNPFDTAYLASRRPYGARPGSPQWFQAGLKLDL